MAAPGSERPRIRVAAVVIVDGRVLLVRHRKGRSTYHLLPGGGVERGERLDDALRREVAEETGLRVEPVRPLFISDTIAPDVSRHVVNITFLAEPVDGALTQEPDDARVEGVDLVEPERLASLDLRPPIAGALAAAAAEGFTAHAAYLGALWTEEQT